MPSDHLKAKPGRTRTRRILLPLTTLLIGLSPFVFLEIGLRLSGARAGDSTPDPLSGFNLNIPLFEREGATYRTARSREPFFPPQEFAVTKPANGFRIFCFGGSTVHGHPYQSETAFPKWLQMELCATDTNRVYQAINCGGVSYASYRLAPLVKEVTRYEPDLIVVATGENEFLEDRTYESVKTRPKVRRWLEDAFHSLRIVTVARDWIHRRQSNRSDPAEFQDKISKSEIQTRLDTLSGYASYHRDAVWHDRVAAQFEESLQHMVVTCRQAHVPLLFVKLGSNLRDCPPYKSEHRVGLSLEEERTWQALFDEASGADADLASGVPSPMPVPTESGLEERAGERRTLPHGLALESDALAIYRKAEQIDAAYALLLFRIARLLDRQGERQAALEYYLRARDQDICPLRSTTRHEEILNKVAERTKTPLLDAANAIAEQSMDRIPGNDWYLDHVHPAIGGHQLIAQRLVARIRDLRIIPPLGQWTDVERQSAYTAQMEKLGPHYLAEGQRRVQWLEYWARRERLFEETVPRNAAAFLRAGFRHLELGDEETARNEIKEALKRDKNLEQEVGRCAHRLAAEGRVAAAQRSREWTSH